MRYHKSPLYPAYMVIAAAVLGGMVCAALAAEEEVVLFNGKDLSGWKLRNAALADSWKVVSAVELDKKNPGKLAAQGEGGAPDSVMLRADVKKGSDIISEKQFGDCQLHVEFMVPKGSNSGVYLMGRYEIQILDSFGREKAGPGDCGGLYGAAAPRVNASKAPGEWQTFDVIFRAPRFDASGKKIENAKFVSVILNGQVIHENVEMKGPTGGSIGAEAPIGPLMFQGDHGIVAFRNIKVKPLEAK